MERDDLHQQFMSLKEQLSHLGTHLANAGDYLQDYGALPSQELIEEIVTARAEFDRFRSTVLAEAHSLDLQPVPELDELSSLSKLESLLHSVAHAGEAKGEAEDIRQYAVTTLARMRMLYHFECDHFAPLVDIQTKAAELGDAVSDSHWTDLPADAQALANGSHPFSTLLTLVERQAELDDDTWIRLQEIVDQSFGKPMSVAAARGKLFLAETTPAERLTAFVDTNDEKTASEEYVAPSLSPHLIPPEQTVTPGDEAISIIPPGDMTQGSGAISQDDQVTPPPAEEATKMLPEADGEESQVIQAETAVAMTSHSEQSEAPTATITEEQHTPEDDAQYNAHSMKQAVLDRLLKEQLDSVRKEVAARQKQNFIKSIGRRFK